MSAIKLAKELPQDVVRSLTLAGMLEKADVSQLKAETEEQGVEFIHLLRAALIHLASYTLELTGAVMNEHECERLRERMKLTPGDL